jgi:hypothetical protein
MKKIDRKRHTNIEVCHNFIKSSILGFCKNDNAHDVFLLAEAFESPEDDADLPKKTGEAKFAIYPRTNAPRIDLTVDPGDDMYRYTDVLTLLKTLEQEDVEMHCGRVKFTGER